MAFTLLQAINKTLKRVGVIQGDAGELTDLTDTARQQDIDVAVDVWNEITHELYSRGLFTGETAEGTITLASGDREYALATDFERFTGDRNQRILKNSSSGYWVTEYPGGYAQMLVDQITATDYNGQPTRYAINTTNGEARMDTSPESGQAGDVYTYLYDKRLALATDSDTFPYSDTVVDSLVPAVSELWKRDRRREFDSEKYKRELSKGVRYLTQTQPNSRWGQRWVR